MKLLRIAVTGFLLVFSLNLNAQRQMEHLDHSLLAVNTASGVYVNWRILASEYEAVQYNLYRDGTLVNVQPISGASNFLDTGGSLSSTYEIRTVINGVENTLHESTTVWEKKYIDIPVRAIDGDYTRYELNDASAGDLDGDGQYEIVVKRLVIDNQKTNTDYHYLEAYELDGTFLWAINIGPNIFDKVEFNFLVWDFDGDGKAEVAARTSEGMIDGLGNQLGDVDGDGTTNYRYSITSVGYRSAGPDFLSIFDGETGEEIARDNYIERDPISQWGLPGMNIDQYAHRATKCMFSVAYLDGKTPSIVISRGIYEKIAMEAWNFRDGQLTKVWYFASDQPGNSAYAKQGNHNLTQGDVDNDGRDEIMYGSMCIDDDGTGLYSTELGHGDALHLADIDPDHKGLEFFGCLENNPVWGGNYRDAGTGEIFFHKGIGRDMGRAGCSDITPNYPGMEMWGPSGFPFLTSTSKEINNLDPPGSMNFFIWWDGDATREILDHAWYGDYGIGNITKYNNGQNTTLLSATGTLSNNWTKGTPCVSADILGDWREEVIWRTSDNTALRLYTTTDVTDLRIYTLMHDPQYRAAVGWQPNSYNQPPHPGIFIGNDMDSIPPAPIMMEGQKVWTSGTWDLNTSTSWDYQGNSVGFESGDSLLFDISGDNSADVLLEGDLQPSDLKIISPYDYVFSGTGNISGSTMLTKAGEGKLTLETDHGYSGTTRVWAGELCINGRLSNSRVLVKRFAAVSGSGHIDQGLNLEKFSSLKVGSSEAEGDTLFINGHLSLDEKTGIYLDLSSDPTGVTVTNDMIIVDGDMEIGGELIIYINLLEGELNIGTYILADVSGTFTGNLEDITILGLSGTAFTLKIENNDLVLEVPETRASSTVVWQGGVDNEWDIFNKLNWLKDGVPDVFIGNDTVVFNDQAMETDIQIMGIYGISHFLYESSMDMTISGEGYFTGDASLFKKGSGKLTLNTLNEYTGVTNIEEGTLAIPEIKNAGVPSGIGSAGAEASNIVINGGSLAIMSNGNSSTDRGITIGENNGGLNIANGSGYITFNAPITGPGYLVKEGPGTLILNSNSHKGTVIKFGTIQLGSEDANFTGVGDEVIFEGGILAMNDNYNSYTNNCSWDMFIDAGRIGTLRMDGRSSITGVLTGSGTLNLYLPWIRNEVNGNWSQFEGRINATTDSDGGWFLVSNSNGFGKASITLGDGIEMKYTNSSTVTVEIGELSGHSGSVLGAGGEGTNTITWKVGGKNTDATFDGVINNYQFKNSGAQAAIIKTGTGRWTLTNSNVYTGGTTVEQGTLVLENSSGSATGTGSVICKTGAYLAGNGSVSGSVNIQDGGNFLPGYTSIGSFTIGGSLTLSDGATMLIDVNPESQISDITNVTTNITLGGILIVSNNTASGYSEGDAFQLFSAGGTISGEFTNIYPSKPAEGLIWNTSALNQTGTLMVDKATGTEEMKSLSGTSVYPNPFHGEFIVETSLPVAREQIRVYSIKGEEIEAEITRISERGWRVKTDHLSPGKYMLLIDRDGVDKFSTVLIKIK